ncbi:DNA-binding domain-containing protein [Yoonia sp. 2307UL14-13]|uniref:DNA-binding domain-containing protein n=1 Tax=Yoonia sp. 2307UL14-13 TaxID=3126506 RepID=UPI00309B93B5
MNVDQATFRDGLLNPDMPAPDGLRNPDGQAARKRFDVYRNNVAVSLTEALETAFPVIRKLVGDQFFKAMAGVFLRQHPPSSPLMMFYGAEMPAFLSNFGPAQSVPYLPDIARLELALRHAYHAADAAPLDPQALGALAPDALAAGRLRFAPAICLVRSNYPIYGIHRANTRSDAPKPAMQAEAVLVTRVQFDPEIHPLDTATADCMAALIDGVPLGDAIGDCDIGALLGLLLGQGAVTEIY